MKRLHIITCGVSLSNKTIDASRKGEIIRIGQVGSRDENEARAQARRLAEEVGFQPEDCVELASMIGEQRLDDVHDGDQVLVLGSDTEEGFGCALAIGAVLELRGYPVRSVRVVGLNAETPTTFAQAMVSICEAVEEVHDRSITRHIWHISGGYKAIGQVATTLASALSPVLDGQPVPKLWTKYEGQPAIEIPLAPLDKVRFIEMLRDDKVPIASVWHQGDGPSPLLLWLREQLDRRGS